MKVGLFQRNEVDFSKTQQIKGQFLLNESRLIAGPFVFFRLSNVPRHHRSCLMDADGGSV